MSRATQQRLLALNRAFYATVAEPFDATRAGLPIGWQPLRAWLPKLPVTRPLRVLDVGCGNGRWARALAGWELVCDYTGVDGDSQLLELAATHTRALPAVTCHFYAADFTVPGWATTLALPLASFDLVVCLAALHHVPGAALRGQVVRDLAALLAPTGVLLFSHWQFLQSERLVRKQVGWERIGLTLADVEVGDALLPWQQGAYALRYVHQIDATEMAQLGQAAGLQLRDTFYADGKEGNLNLYACLAHAQLT
ncbi:MAG: methyltransferase domain-containing protein [Caldilineaceae bacterium]|nr:methyltransferase domain-containing protein [Caldilineaceae bacterium]